jgi:hypothetical protein
MEKVTVLTFNEPEHAEPARRRLEEAGIPATINDERKLQKYWFISEPLAGIQVCVPLPEYERARKLLHEWDATEGILREAIHCPECGSSRVEYPQFTRKFITPTFGALLAAIGLVQREFYCVECQYTWPVKQRVRAETDILGWPIKQPSKRG